MSRTNPEVNYSFMTDERSDMNTIYDYIFKDVYAIITEVDKQ